MWWPLEPEFDYSKEYPEMATFIRSTSPSGIEEEFRRAYNEGRIGVFVVSLDEAMSKIEAEPMAAFAEVKEVLGRLLVAVIQSGRDVGEVLAPFHKYQGPSDLKTKWQLACRGADVPSNTDTAHDVRRIFDSIIEGIEAIGGNAGTADPKTIRLIQHADVRLVANLVSTVGGYLFETRAFEIDKIPF